MRSNVSHYSLALIISMGALGMSGCGGGDGDSARVAQTIDASKNGVTSIALQRTETDGYVHINGKLQFNLIGTDGTGKQVNLNNSATWTLSDKSLGSIKNGLFTAAGKMGTGLVLTASYAGLPTQAQDIVLSDANLTGITLSHPTNSVDVCKNTTLNTSTVFSDGKNYDYPLTWALFDSASTALANIADATKPEVSTNKSGEIKIIARGEDNNKNVIESNVLSVTIASTLTKLTLTSDKNLEMRQGQTATITATGEYSTSTPQKVTENASLKSDNPGALSVNTTTGLVTALLGSFNGTTITLTATCDGVEAKLPIKVMKPAIQKMEIVSKDNTNAIESLSVSVGSSIEPRIKVTYPTSVSVEPEIYSGQNVEWEIINTPADYDSSKVTFNTKTGKLDVNSSWALNTNLTVTLSAKLLDEDNRVALGSDQQELKDTIQVVINR